MKMQRNHNEQQIVMSVEHYNQLIGMSCSGMEYDPQRIQRHVRKFNPFLQAPHQERVKTFESKRSKRIREVRDLVEKHHGEVLYGITDVRQYANEEQGPVYTPVRVRRINKEKRWLVDTYKPEETKFGYYTKTSVTADTLFVDVPEGYIQLLGPGVYRNLFVKEWSGIHFYHLQEQAERENWEREEYLEKQRMKAYRESNPRVELVSAIGER
jgi:hypothetical protein